MKKILLALMISMSFTSAFANIEENNLNSNILMKVSANSGIHQIIKGNQNVQAKSCVQKTFQQCVAEYNECRNSTGPWNWGFCFQQLDRCGICLLYTSDAADE